MRTLFVIFISSVLFFSCKKEDEPMPVTESQPIKYYGRLISDKHGNNTHIRDTFINCILTHTISGNDSFIQVSILIPQLNSKLTAQFVPAVVLSDTNNKVVTGGADCITWQFKRSLDLKTVAYVETAICEPGTDYFFEGVK